jgi:hypothetical protein
MTEKVEMILRKELIKNREQLQSFIDFPRLHKPMSILPPKERKRLPFDDLGKNSVGTGQKAQPKNAKAAPLDEDGVAAMHFKKMKGGLDFIGRMMGSLENSNAQMASQIESVEGERKVYGGLESQPLEKLQAMLEEWEGQEMGTKDDIVDYAHELWKTAEQFEKELKNSMKGHEIEMKKLKFSYSTRIEWIKHKTSTHILALEEALRLTKESNNQKIENMTMRLCEFESRLLNQQVEEPELSHILFGK